MRKAFLLAGVLVLAACSSKSGSASSTGSTAASGSSAAASGSTAAIDSSSAAASGGAAPVSAECHAAMKVVATAGFDATDAQQVATLGACKSKGEWLAGAEAYHGPDQHNVIVGTTTKGEDVLNAICDGHLDLPACQ